MKRFRKRSRPFAPRPQSCSRNSEGGLKKKTVQGHTGNLWFYIDAYLVSADATRPADAISLIDGFFSGFFPNKATWSNVATTNETVAGPKRFDRLLAERGLLERADYDEFLSELKSQMPVWRDNDRLE
jgi:hypothetical protein